ncbi:MAG: hypothetical protein CMJ48_02210 [Planctomycetaceae bacterium]|nr:hypothetical protein [Planctomycetaceae bacterium]
MRQVEFSRDGTRLLSRDKQGEVLVWLADSGKLLWRIDKAGSKEDRYRAWTAALSPNGKYVISSDGVPLVKVWSIDRPQEPPAVLGSVRKRASRGTFSPDGLWIATNYDPLVIWDRASLRMRHEVSMPAGMPGIGQLGGSQLSYQLAFSPDGTMLARSIQRVLDVVDVKTGKRIGRWPARYRNDLPSIYGLAWSPDSKLIAVTQSSVRRETPVVVEARTMKIVTKLTIPDEQSIWVLQFSPDGRQIAGGRSTLDMYGYTPVSLMPADDLVWDAKTGKVIAKLRSPIGTRPIFSPDGKRIVNSGQHPTVWKLQ